MSDQRRDEYAEDLSVLRQDLRDIREALQGKTGDTGLVATVGIHQHVLFDEDEGLVQWKRKMDRYVWKISGAVALASFLGALLGWYLKH